VVLLLLIVFEGLNALSSRTAKISRSQVWKHADGAERIFSCKSQLRDKHPTFLPDAETRSHFLLSQDCRPRAAELESRQPMAPPM